MLAAPTWEDVLAAQENRPAPVVGILFAPPFTRVGAETLVPRLGYLDARSGPHIHFFCAGYGGYRFADDQVEIHEMRYDNGTVIPWGFSQRLYAQFVSGLEAESGWRHSGEGELLLMGPDVSLGDVLLFDIEAMIRDEAIPHSAALFEAVIQFARQPDLVATLTRLSDTEGVRVFSDFASQSIQGLLPPPLRGLWKRGRHYAVRDLRRAA